jgi:hypothetical protein
MSRAPSIMIEHRTQALATVFLTGRNNVDVISLRDLGDLSMICRILTDEDNAEMVFGVIHGGVAGPIESERWAEKWLNTYSPRALKTVKKYPFPVLILLFSMQSDEGVFSWRMEPDISEGVPALILNERFACEKATRTGLDSVLKRVRSWYAAYYDRMIRIK